MSPGTPRAAGLAMPAEAERHERTVMCWPVREPLWGERLEEARADHATVANAIAAFEPVTMVVAPADAASARAALTGEGVDVVEIPIDDSWARDSGPIFVADPGRTRRAGVHFRFNAWGEKYPPWDRDAAFGGELLEHLGEERFAAPIVLEGGSIAVDGAGTLVTTAQCLLEEHRNPGLGRPELEAALRDWLGIERVVWLELGLAEDRDTDGHVDNVCAFAGPGRAVLQTVEDEANPNHERSQANRTALEAAGIEVTEIPWLPYVAGEDPPRVVPYLNFYVCNGALIVPVTGADTDDEALGRLAALYPGREAVPVPGETLARGGGGVHCITQQVPALAAA